MTGRAGDACVRSDRFPTTDEWNTKRHGTVECSACSQRVRLAQRRLDRDASPDNTYIVEHDVMERLADA